MSFVKHGTRFVDGLLNTSFEATPVSAKDGDDVAPEQLGARPPALALLRFAWQPSQASRRLALAAAFEHPWIERSLGDPSRIPLSKTTPSISSIAPTRLAVGVDNAFVERI